MLLFYINGLYHWPGYRHQHIDGTPGICVAEAMAAMDEWRKRLSEGARCARRAKLTLFRAISMGLAKLSFFP